MGKHTEGDWVVMPGTSAPRICVDGDPEWPIVVIVSGHSKAGIKANEHILSAAPNMFEALAIVASWLPEYVTEDNQMRQMVEAALKKAKGE